MRKLVAAAGLVALMFLQPACGGGGHGGGQTPGATLTGSLFGKPFTVGDALLVHPQAWKSAAAGSTAILVSDTPNLCAQITSAKTSAPGRFLLIRLEQRDASGGVTALTPGTFTTQGEGTPSSRYGDVYADAVDASCVFSKLFTASVQVDVTSIGASGAPLSGSLTAQYSNNETVTGTFDVSATCDETAVDAWLNRNPTCG